LFSLTITNHFSPISDASIPPFSEYDGMAVNQGKSIKEKGKNEEGRTGFYLLVSGKSKK